jgi:hypothetical protein
MRAGVRPPVFARNVSGRGTFPPQELDAAFDRDLKDCYPFEPAEYRRSPLLKRLRDSTARLLSPLL